MSSSGVSIETRKGRLYLYSRRRVNGRLRGEYVGPLSPVEADFIRGRAESGRECRTAGRRDVAAVDRAAAAVLSAGAEFDQLADRVFRAVMYLTGHGLHRRSEWRRKRGVRPMAKLKDLLDSAGPKEPTPAIIKPVSTDPEHQKILERAAKGDRSALPAVLDLFKNPRYLSAFGTVGGMAQTALIRQAAGDDLAVLTAIGQKFDEYMKNLLADAGSDCTFAERLAATRAAHNWLAVHILECKAASYPSGSAQAVVLDRRVSQAERRLHASLKSLAVLRRLRRPAKVTQVNVANGPMLVDNRREAVPGPTADR